MIARHVRWISVFLIASAASALESPVVTVVRWTDSGLLVSGLNDDGEVPVQLAWTVCADALSTSEDGLKRSKNQVRKELQSLVAPGAAIRLWIPDPPQAAKDAKDAKKAPGAKDADKDVPTDASAFSTAIVLLGKRGKRSVQESVMRDGWALYDTSASPAPAAWETVFTDAVQVARKSKSGAWGTDAAVMANRMDQKR
ncbi:MAG: hypothetical protein H0V44_17930 [Planctomycetes bacterium]|nr:hypothetical protein [Planctomycetota bacterium]